MRTQNLWLLGLALILTAASSCAVSMKMQGNRFESSEVYGKTAFRLKTAFQGQANVELTDDYTSTPPNTTDPEIGPTHNLVIGGGVGIKDRFELSFDTSATGTAKLQIIGDPKLRAKSGNFSLSVLGSLHANGYTNSDSNWVSGQGYRLRMDYSTLSAAILAGYRADDVINFYFGPFTEYGKYSGNYETVGVSSFDFSGKGRNAGGIIGMEIGSPRISGIIEGVWNHTRSASVKNSYWVAGTQIVVTFGSTDDSSTR